MTYRANLSIAPTTLTDLKITVIDNTEFSKIYTLDDCTISNYIECEIDYTNSSTTANIYSPGYQVENIVLTDYDGSVINLTPISDYSKTSDGTNTYYVKDNYERSLANDIYNITQAQLASKEDINNKVTSLSSSSTNIQYPSAKCVYDELALKEDSLGYTPADVNLTNINSSCKALDGQWVMSYLQLAQNVSIAGSSSNAYSLASYLPDDNYDYEVIVTVMATTGTTSGNNADILIGNNLYTGIGPRICFAVTRTNTSVTGAGQCILIVPNSDRRVVINQASSTAATLNLVRVNGYRRIGTNS